MRGPARQRVLALVHEAEEAGRLCVARAPGQAQQLSLAVSCGLLVRPYPAVYAAADRWRAFTPEKRNLYAARALGQLHPDWVFAGPTAALAHGLSVGWSCLGEVCVATSRRAHTKGRAGIRRIMVTGDTPVVRSGLRVTSFMRTVYDCLRTLPFCDAIVVADSVLRNTGVSSERLKDNVVRLFGKMPGVKRVCGIIDLADGRAENGGESFARAQMIQLGYAAPDLQRVVSDPLDCNKSYRADFAWDLPAGTAIYGELDGRDKYDDPAMTDGRDTTDVLLAERRRESHMTIVGAAVRVMRFSMAEVRDAKGFARLLDAYGVPLADVTPAVACA